MGSKRTKRKMEGDLTDDQRASLQWGFCIFGDDARARRLPNPDFPWSDEAEMRAVWKLHRDDFLRWQYGLDETRRRPRPAGTRPHGWWRFDSPGPRLDGESELDALRRLGALRPDEEEALKSDRPDLQAEPR